MAYNVPLSSLNATDGNVIYGENTVLKVGQGANITVSSSLYESGGNVGVGTASPLGQLNVYGNIRISNTATMGGLIFPDGTFLSSGASSAVTIVDDTSTNATRYLTFTGSTSGTASNINVSSTKLTYNPSTAAVSLIGGNLSVSNSGQFGNLSITNTTATSSTTTGALTVAGGVGITSNLFVGGSVNVVTKAGQVSNSFTVAKNNGDPLVQVAGDATQTDDTVGILTLYDNGVAKSGDGAILSVHTDDDAPYLAKFYNHLYSTSMPVFTYFAWADGRMVQATESAAPLQFSTNGYDNVRLTITADGLVDISGDASIANRLRTGNLSVLNTTPATSTTTGAVTIAGGVGIANGAVIAGNVGIGTSSITGFANNALSVYGKSSFYGNIYLTNASTTSGIVFADGTFQNTVPVPLTTSNILTTVANVTLDIQGIVDRTQSQISVNDSTRTINVSPTSTSWDYYYQGELHTVSSNISLSIANTSGARFIRIDPSNNTLVEGGAVPNFITQVIVAYLYWNSSEQKFIIVGDERHGSQRDTTWHQNQHLNVGTVWRSGGAPTYTLNDDSNVTIGLSTPINIADEDLLHVITNSASPSADYEQTLYPTASMEVLYLDGTSYNSFTTSSNFWVAGTSLARYNPVVSGSGSLADATEGSYITYWLIATNDIRNPVKMVMGRFLHTSVDDAYSEEFTEYGLSFAEQVFMYQFVIRTSSAYTNNAAKIVIAGVRKILSKLATNASTVSAAEHNLLTGRDAADAHPIDAVTNLQSSLDAKQAVLVSGTNIKTINGNNILGSGNFDISNIVIATTNTNTSFYPTWASATSGLQPLYAAAGLSFNPANSTFTIGGNISVGNSAWFGNASITNSTATTSTTTGALTVAGGVGIANGAVIAGNVGIGTSATTGYTNNALAVFRNSLFKSNIYVTNSSTISGIIFSDGTFQNTAPTTGVQQVLSYTTANSSTTAFSTSPYTSTTAYMQVYVNGVYQPVSTWSWSSTTVTLNTPAPNGALVDLIFTTSYSLSATTAQTVTINSTSTNASYYPTFVSATTGSLGPQVSSQLTYNPSTQILSVGNLTVAGIGTFNGSSSSLAALFANSAEVVTVSATAATGTINFDVTTQSVLYYTTNASANWTVNFRASSGTSLNTAMLTGQSVTVAFLVTQGATPYYNSNVTVDGNSVTPKWQGGYAPSTGNASSVDVYSYTIIKTGAATFTVLAGLSQYK